MTIKNVITAYFKRLTQTTPATKCLTKTGVDKDSCDNYGHEDCVYADDNIFFEPTAGSIVDASHCQELCQVFDPQCQYWVFTSNQFSTDGASHCLLYYSFNVGSCAAVNGPQAPHRTDCV